MQLRTGIVALLLAAAAASALDVVHCKDRRELKGIVLSESEDELDFRSLILSDRGEILGSADCTIPKSEIERIERMPMQERRVLLARSEALGESGLRLLESLAKIRVTPTTLQGRRAQRAESTHFEIISTCDAQFIKEVTHYLDEMFRAYQRNFRVREDRPPRIKVYVLADRKEYEWFQRARFGSVLQNPAFYSLPQNCIAACNLVPNEKAAEIRSAIEAEERKARDYKEKLDGIEKQFAGQVRDARRQIDAAATREKRKIQRRNSPTRDRELRSVDAWRRAELGKLKGKEREARAKLDAERKRVNTFIRGNRDVILRNFRILATANEQMFEMLFHEGFHAFAYNYLWAKGRRQFVPRWLDEGLACYYESSAVEAGYLIHGGVSKARLARIANARAANKLLPIGKIVTGDAQDFLVAAGASGEHSGIYYAQSWAIAHYMADRIPSSRIQAYVLAVNAGFDRKKAFELLMGMPLPRVEAEIRAHLVKMR